MSTILYAFIASSEENLQEQIATARALVQANSAFHALARREGIEFQVFSTTRGLIYRVLDYGYMVRNLMWDAPETFPQCNYDNRTDIPEADLPNEILAQEIDQLIRTNEYYLEHVFPKEDFLGIGS